MAKLEVEITARTPQDIALQIVESQIEALRIVLAELEVVAAKLAVHANEAEHERGS